MKRMHWALSAVAISALMSGAVFAQDIDLRSLQQQLAKQQAQIAEQNARLNDLQAKINSGTSYGATADNVMSLRKAGRVTIGGDINVRMYNHNANIKSMVGDENFDLITDAAGRNSIGVPGAREKVMEWKTTDFKVSDAKLRVKVDVNDWFEAFIRMDLQDSDAVRAFTAQEAYLHWKNICNSGFGVLAGRTSVVFGGGNEADSVYSGFYGGSNNSAWGDTGVAGMPGLREMDIIDVYGSSLIGASGIVPAFMGWDMSRTTQITPYWENANGTFKAELSYIQALDTRSPGSGANVYIRANGSPNGKEYTYERYRSINSGFGSGSIRLTWQPIEGLKIIGSAINLHSNVSETGDMSIDGNLYAGGWVPPWRIQSGLNEYRFFDTTKAAKNLTMTNIHIAYTPCFLPALKVWAAWNHQWNGGYIENYDGDVIHAGLKYQFTPKFAMFGIYEGLRAKNKDTAGLFYKNSSWASYVGVQFNWMKGLSSEIAWRHENYEWKDRSGVKHTKAKLDTIYGSVQFAF